MLRTVLSLMGEHDRLLKAGGVGLQGHVVAGAAPAALHFLVPLLMLPNMRASHWQRGGPQSSCSISLRIQFSCVGRGHAHPQNRERRAR